jgi:MYXO-CTERM domain-containing protein
MSNKSWAFAALTALALSAQAQVYNWTLSTTGNTKPGNGSGTLTLTGGIVTAMNGNVGGGSVTLLPVNGYVGNDNKLPLTGQGISFTVGGFGDLNVYEYGPGFLVWTASVGSGLATFNYTPVPEPSTWAMGGAFGLAAVMTVAARRRQRANQS